MRNTISTIAIVGLIALAPAAAQANASKQENVGVGAGAIVGAAAGGPVGLIIGAAIGATIGDNIHKKEGEIVRMQRIARPEVVSLLQAGIAMDLLFRTDESVLADTTGIRLNDLATTLASMPDIHVQLDGFADERGTENYNQKLSEQRVEFVRNQLVAAGIDNSRISVAAHGESPAQDESIDSYALERRVSLTLFIDNTPSLAANPN